MTRTQKNELILHISLFRELVSRQYHIEDEADPRVEVRALKSNSRSFIAGLYDIDANTIVLSPSNASCDTIAHELAHWVQYQQRGATDCSSTPIRRRNLALASEHAQIQKAIAHLMQTSGYDAAINELWA